MPETKIWDLIWNRNCDETVRGCGGGDGGGKDDGGYKGDLVYGVMGMAGWRGRRGSEMTEENYEGEETGERE